MPQTTFFNLPPEKRQRIVECAIDEFAANDYDSASISKVVTQAGIAKGSLYQYFADKNDLYQYLLELVANTKTDMMNELPQGNKETGIFDRLQQLFNTMISFELRHPKLAQIGNRALRGTSPLPEEMIRRSKQSTHRHFASLVEEGKRNGEIRQDVDADMAALIFTSTLAELGSYIKGEQPEPVENLELTPTSVIEIEHLYRHILNILQNGLAGTVDKV